LQPQHLGAANAPAGPDTRNLIRSSQSSAYEKERSRNQGSPRGTIPYFTEGGAIGQDSSGDRLSVPPTRSLLRPGGTLPVDRPPGRRQTDVCPPHNSRGSQNPLRHGRQQDLPGFQEKHRRALLGHSGRLVRGYLPDVVLRPGYGI